MSLLFIMSHNVLMVMFVPTAPFEIYTQNYQFLKVMYVPSFCFLLTDAWKEAKKNEIAGPSSEELRFAIHTSSSMYVHAC